jgi:RNA polymerase sigma-70 factor (ECF subfamily)
MDRNLPRDPLLALREGDPGPFEELVRTHARTLVSFFRQRGTSLGRAEDLTQEVFLKLFRSAERYQPEERFEAFLFRVARNAWIDECRRRGVRPEAESTAGAEDELVAQPDDPLARVASAEEGARLLALIAALGEPHRAVFELAVLGDLGYEEIARVLGIPEGTVKSRMFYAVRRLRQAWSEGEERS